MADADDACVICLDGSEAAAAAPIQGGCACRGGAGLAHVECRLRLAEAKTSRARVATEWWRCSTCNAHFTGETRRFLSRELSLRAAADARLRDIAMHVHISTELADGRYVAAERDARAHLARIRESPRGHGTLALEAASFLAEALAGQRRDEEAAVIRSAVLEESARTLGDESGQTLNAAGRLASSLSRTGRYAAAEALLRRSIRTTTRVFGPADLHTLGQQHALAQLFRLRGARDEAEPLLRGVLAGTRRVLGPEHPSTVSLVREIAQL